MSHLQMQEIERSASCASLSMLHIAGMYSNTQIGKPGSHQLQAASLDYLDMCISS